MKRIYIKPEAELVEIKITPVLEGSDPGTTWGVGSQEIDPGEEPDPNKDAKQFNLWDDWE